MTAKDKEIKKKKLKGWLKYFGGAFVIGIFYGYLYWWNWWWWLSA
jgi:hypothetical protein